MTVATRKAPALRAFVGMAGSPLAKIKKLLVEKSDHTLRIPKTPDREDPIPFDIWFDTFGQKHGAIDLDCGFQEYAFDPVLGHGANPLESHGASSHAGANRNDESSPLQDLGIALDASGRKPSIKAGLIEGEREIKRRRPTEKSWWVFNGKLLREFLQTKYDPENTYEAEKTVFVLYLFYYENRQDEDIYQETTNLLSFDTVKQVKQFRQFITKQGAERFKDLKPESTWHGRQAVWRDRRRCDDPNC